MKMLQRAILKRRKPEPSLLGLQVKKRGRKEYNSWETKDKDSSSGNKERGFEGPKNLPIGNSDSIRKKRASRWGDKGRATNFES